jgi:hypothetical protein
VNCHCSLCAAFSLLFDGTQQPARVLLLDRDKRTYIDLQKEKKAAKQDRKSEVLWGLHDATMQTHSVMATCAGNSVIPRRTVVLVALHASNAIYCGSARRRVQHGACYCR